MSNRDGLGLLVACVAGIVFIVTLLAAFPPVGYMDGEIEAEKIQQSVKMNQKTDPMLLVPETTTGEKPQQYIPNWDKNPVAYVPESTMVDISLFSKEALTVEELRQHTHDWADNPVSTIPESTMAK